MDDQASSSYKLMCDLVLGLIQENAEWSINGCFLTQLQSEANIPFDLGEVVKTMPQISFDSSTGYLKLRPKKRKVGEKEKKKKPAITEPPSLRSKELETLILGEYFRKHLVSEPFAARANHIVSNLRYYLETRLHTQKVFVHVVGSFASGLASRSESTVDVAVRVGDQGDALQCILPVMINCPFFATVNRRDDVIDCMLDYGLVVTVHAFNSVNFPINWLHHARLFSSMARSSPLFTLVTSYVKSWARSNRLITKDGLGGFEWTVIVSAFLISERLIDNPFIKLDRKEQFGPNPNQSYGFIASRDHENISVCYHETIRTFFVWLINLDLTMNRVSVESIKPTASPGWISIKDPINERLTAVTDDMEHGDVLGYSMDITEAARQAIKLFK